MKIVNMHEAKTTLSALVAAVEGGETVTIARNGTPIVDLVPHAPRIARQPGVLAADPAWRDWVFDPAAFAPMTDAEVDAEGWP